MIGIDAVDIERLRVVMERSKGTEERLFTRHERDYCRGRGDPVLHYAGTLAAKEAVIKAASLGSLVTWGRRIEIRRKPSGAPEAKLIGIAHGGFNLSISHDGPVAVAVAITRWLHPSYLRADVSASIQTRDVDPRPNEQLLRYIAGRRRPKTAPRFRLEESGSVCGTDFP